MVVKWVKLIRQGGFVVRRVGVAARGHGVYGAQRTQGVYGVVVLVVVVRGAVRPGGSAVAPVVGRWGGLA